MFLFEQSQVSQLNFHSNHTCPVCTIHCISTWQEQMQMHVQAWGETQKHTGPEPTLCGRRASGRHASDRHVSDRRTSDRRASVRHVSLRHASVRHVSDRRVSDIRASSRHASVRRTSDRRALYPLRCLSIGRLSSARLCTGRSFSHSHSQWQQIRTDYICRVSGPYLGQIGSVFGCHGYPLNWAYRVIGFPPVHLPQTATLVRTLRIIPKT